MRLRRRNTAWLGIIGALIGVVLLSGAASPQVAVTLVGLFLVALAASVIEIQPNRLLNTMPQNALSRMRMSPQAREAAERARRRTSYAPAGLTLLDVGLISLHSSSEGMMMRRTRNISLDDDGVRPYITLHVQPQEADRTAVVRFEILDQNGQAQYIHEMKTYLRDGELNILADHHLPLTGNDRLPGAGDWDLRVSIDGVLTGALIFTTTPSLREREKMLRRSAARETDSSYQLVDEADESPVSLEDLLRSQQRQNRQ
ncbi:MAG: DUF3040 domain-containing protein [Anaerolineae bacterium]|nr:DUF3040 domain-containing protein [Anaerolineae bacterium]